jgi:hypothetical protein
VASDRQDRQTEPGRLILAFRPDDAKRQERPLRISGFVD